MKFLFHNIKWDTDDIPPKKLNLPSSVTITIDASDFNPSLEGADKLSDMFGFCVFSFNFNRL